MILEMKVPSPGESITEVEIAEWLVQDGDYVEKDQAIAEVDSDKATLELPAEQSGTITLKAEEGDAVAVGAVVCLIDTSASKPKGTPSSFSNEKPAVTSVAPTPVATPKTTYASGSTSPAAKKILAEKNIDVSTITGTGKDGRITKEDALNAVPSMGQKVDVEGRVVQRTKLSKTAMLTTFNEVDMSPIFELRKQYKELFKEKHEVGLGFMSFFTLAVVRALKLFPAVNSMIDGKEMISYDFCDISIAVSGPKGLMVPVIRNAENLTFSDNEFDFVLCKESYHHFPRPMLALTEMFRVAKIGVILIEPRDYDIDRSLFSFVNKTVNIFKKRKDGHFFEEVGNYVYTTSERELEKFMLGIHHNTIAFSGINDHYSNISGYEIENLNLPMKLNFLRLKTIIAVKNLLNLLSIRKTNLLKAILFKNNLNEDLKFIIKKEGFKFKILPKNPYI